MVGSHGDGKLQPFMVAFFRASLPTAHGQLDQHGFLPSVETTSEEDEEGEDVSPGKNHRIRRQTPSNNRKRSKESEDFGAWNPYTGYLKKN